MAADTTEANGWTIRVRAGVAEYRDAGGTRWFRIPLRSIARSYGRGEHPWPWLRERGISRPSPSGPTTPEAERGTESIKLRLPPAIASRLRMLARTRGCSVGKLVSTWVVETKPGAARPGGEGETWHEDRN